MRTPTTPRRTDKASRDHTRIRAGFIRDYLSASERGDYATVIHIRRRAGRYDPNLLRELDGF